MAFTTTQLFKLFLKEKDLFNGKALSYVYSDTLYNSWLSFINGYKIINLKINDIVSFKFCEDKFTITHLIYPYCIVKNGNNTLKLPLDKIDMVNGSSFTLLWNKA